MLPWLICPLQHSEKGMRPRNNTQFPLLFCKRCFRRANCCNSFRCSELTISVLSSYWKCQVWYQPHPSPKQLTHCSCDTLWSKKKTKKYTNKLLTLLINWARDLEPVMQYCPRISPETRNINLTHKPRTMHPKVSWCCFFIMSVCCSQDNMSFQFLFSLTCCFSLKLSCSALTLSQHLFSYNLLQ